MLVGVSDDPHDRQCRFAERLELSFPLIADPERAVIGAFGVAWPLFKAARRVTFILDASGVVVERHWHEVRVTQHATDVVRAFERLRGLGGPAASR